jgi:hypothetical protein
MIIKTIHKTIHKQSRCSTKLSNIIDFTKRAKLRGYGMGHTKSMSL